jgi:hypothetical protein
MQKCVVELFKLAGRKKILVGNERGREVFQALRELIEANPTCVVFEISLTGVEATDASLPRESVVSLFKLLGEKGFYLSGFASQDLVDNWDYAAKAKEQPIVVRDGKAHRLLGPALGKRGHEILSFALGRKAVTTAEVAEKFEMSTQNASATLKKLHVIGLLLGEKEPAESGGLEYVFYAAGAVG